jgi:NAD(P)-dependent dehydrogenase (short-subunit alcohol dehydrogenase family)
MAIGIVTGASRGLGRALASELARQGWSLVIDGRDGDRLEAAARSLRAEIQGRGQIVALPGDVADPGHRVELVEAARALGGLDLLVNNASVLGPSPQPALATYPLGEWRTVYEVNTLAPLALTQTALPLLEAAPSPCIINITSDASVEPYDGWGGYGSSKAALDQWSAILGAEVPAIRVYALDPGDMRTDMHQAAFPGEDISDRPLPETAVPGIVVAITGSLRSGRYRVADLPMDNAASREEVA